MADNNNAHEIEKYLFFPGKMPEEIREKCRDLLLNAIMHYAGQEYRVAGHETAEFYNVVRNFYVKEADDKIKEALNASRKTKE